MAGIVSDDGMAQPHPVFLLPIAGRGKKKSTAARCFVLLPLPDCRCLLGCSWLLQALLLQNISLSISSPFLTQSAGKSPTYFFFHFIDICTKNKEYKGLQGSKQKIQRKLEPILTPTF